MSKALYGGLCLRKGFGDAFELKPFSCYKDGTTDPVQLSTQYLYHVCHQQSKQMCLNGHLRIVHTIQIKFNTYPRLEKTQHCWCDRLVLHLPVNTNVHSLPAVSDRGKVQRPGKASQRDSAEFPGAPNSEKTRWRNPPSSSSEIPARWQGAWMDGYALVAYSDSGHTQVRGYLNSRLDSGPHWEWMHEREAHRSLWTDSYLT